MYSARFIQQYLGSYKELSFSDMEKDDVLNVGTAMCKKYGRLHLDCTIPLFTKHLKHSNSGNNFYDTILVILT